jgi:hypothetical protein
LKNRSKIVSTKDGSVNSPQKSTTNKVAAVREERNPFKFIEKTLIEARAKLDKMKGTP